MRGRIMFGAARPFFRIMAVILRAIPSPLCGFLLTLSRNIPGIIGLGIRYCLVARLAGRCGECVAIFEGVHYII